MSDQEKETMKDAHGAMKRGRFSLLPLSSFTILFRITGLLFIFAVVSCTSGNKPGDPANESNIKRGIKPEADSQTAVIETDFGRIVIELYPNIAPKMVARFKQLIGEGFYDGTAFHRIDPDLGIIQGGDPLSRDTDPQNDGTGSSKYADVEAEFSDVPYERGVLGAARQAAPNTANCQFFITLKRQPAFDERYTVFGRVVEGINNADIIGGAPVDNESERPADRIIIKRITLQPR